MESELLLFLSQSTDVFVTYNSSLQYIYINNMGASLLGLKPEEIIGKTNRDIIGQGADAIEPYIQAAFDKGEKVFVIHEMPLPTGSSWFDTIYTPVFNDEQEIVRVVGVCRDVTDNKMKLEQLENLIRERTEGLRESEALYRNLIETTAAVAWEVDLASQRFIFISPQIMALSGFPVKDWVDFNFWAERIHPEDREQAVSYCQAEVDMGQDHAFEYRMLSADGRTVWVRDCVSIIREGGKPIALRGYFIDITEHKLAEDERRKLDIQVQRAQKLESLGVLAGGIAHDFNNILMGVLGNADLALMQLPSNSPVYRRLELIFKAARRASELVKQMLAYSGKGKFVVEDFNLNEVIMDMKSLLESSASKKNSLCFELAQDLPSVEADVTQLRQIVLNLVINAAEAIGEGDGLITVTTRVSDYDSRPSETFATLSQLRASDSCIVLEVSDTGCGMDDETRTRIFDPFFTTKFTGRGLGLAAVLGIVRGHSGGIRVDSNPGRGTTFTVLLPALDRPAKSIMEDPGKPVNSQGTGTILVVDDEEVIRSVTSEILECLGYSVLLAEDGVKAVEVFKRYQDEIACVLLDLTMPKMGGKETFIELQKIKDDVPVILCSGYSEQDLEKHFGDSEPSGFLQKPFEIALLNEKMTEILGDTASE